MALEVADVQLWVNSHKVEVTKFSGGELNLKIDLSKVPPMVGGRYLIRVQAYNSDTVIAALLAADSVRRQKQPRQTISLVIPYLPYARQDRVCSPGEAFSAQVLADMINGAAFDEVMVFDVHSRVSLELLHRCRNIPQHSLVRRVVTIGDDWTLVSPDEGAREKVQELQGKLSSRPNVLYCTKTRDPATGRLTGFDLPDHEVRQRPYLIVDDICDGGGTFLQLGKALKQKGVKDLRLYVTHGIFSAGFKELGAVFSSIYCPFPFKEIPNKLKGKL